MKIGKFTFYNDEGVLELVPDILNRKYESRNHTLFLRECSSNTTSRYEVQVFKNKDLFGRAVYHRGSLKPKTAISIFNKYNIRLTL